MESICLNFKFSKTKITDIECQLTDTFNDIKKKLGSKYPITFIYQGNIIDNHQTPLYYKLKSNEYISALENKNNKLFNQLLILSGNFVVVLSPESKSVNSSSSCLFC